MMANRIHSKTASRRGRGFSLIELMVAVAITSIIIFALYGVFNQTQQALRANVTQVDVLESGRAALDLISRELESMNASELDTGTNLYVSFPVTLPRIQKDNDADYGRTNVLQQFFFLNRKNNDWEGIGYRVVDAEDGVGRLYRFYGQVPGPKAHRAIMRPGWWDREGNQRPPLIDQFLNGPITNLTTGFISTNWARVADGVLHLKLTAYDPDGFSATDIDRFSTFYQQAHLTPSQEPAPDVNAIIYQQAVPVTSQGTTYSVPIHQYIFRGSAIPAYVEIQLAILEDQALAEYEAVKEAPAIANDFLRQQSAKTQVFRQQVPIRITVQ